jgi:hypothetical protein
MEMQMSMVVDRGKTGSDRVAHAIRTLPPDRLRLRRRSRGERLRDAFQSLPPAARVGLAAAATGVLVGAAFAARKRLFVAAAVVAEAIEEVADTVEDAAEDLSEAARKRADESPAG